MKQTFSCIVITGLSGAGKSMALRALEDLGVFCVDNLPLQLLPHLANLYQESGAKLNRMAVGVDARLGALLDEFTKSLQDLSKRGIRYQILFLTASDEVLMRRYSETRRRHPLGRSVAGGISLERKRMEGIRQIADRIIDTSHTKPNDMKSVMSRVIRSPQSRSMAITVMSFGYKFGVPMEADVVLDVRFIPNPNYIRSLKKLTGTHRRVSSFVLKNALTKKFLKSMKDLFDLTIPQYQAEGKSYLTVAIGCTGGRHRSVAIAERIGEFLKKKNLPTRVEHRDIGF